MMTPTSKIPAFLQLMAPDGVPQYPFLHPLSAHKVVMHQVTEHIYHTPPPQVIHATRRAHH